MGVCMHTCLCASVGHKQHWSTSKRPPKTYFVDVVRVLSSVAIPRALTIARRVSPHRRSRPREHTRRTEAEAPGTRAGERAERAGRAQDPPRSRRRSSGPTSTSPARPTPGSTRPPRSPPSPHPVRGCAPRPCVSAALISPRCPRVCSPASICLCDSPAQGLCDHPR